MKATPENINSVNKKNRLAAHFRNINTLLIVFILAVTIAVNYIMIYNFIDETARGNVQFYTMETVDILNAHLNREISLVREAASSAVISEWFADEDNPEKRAAAHLKMMLFADILQMNSVYFAIDGSMHEYYILSGTPLEEFEPYHTLTSPSIDSDRWYFDAIASDFDYILKLDVAGDSGDFHILIDHKVYHDGKIVGVFSASIEFDDLFEEIFGAYDIGLIKGYVIDSDGLIQMDSTVSRAEQLLGDSSVYNPNEMRHILDLTDDAAFASFIMEHLDNFDFHSYRRNVPSVIRLMGYGDYEYVSIAPVPNTNWFKITFYCLDELFNVVSVLPPILIILSAFIIYIFLNYLLISRLIFKPIHLLNLSVSQTEHNNENIYGLDRDDEIGALARTTRDAWDGLNENNLALSQTITERERQTEILHAMNQMATALFGVVDDAAFEQALPEGLKLLAECMEFDRIYVWLNEEIDGVPCTVMTYEWQGVSGRYKTPLNVGQVISYETQGPLWYEMFIKDECIHGLVKDMNGSEADIVKSCGVITILAVPVHLHGQFWGFVTFDNCHSENILSPDDIEILHSGSLIIASAINRNRQNEAIKEVHKRSMLLLDAAPLACSLWTKDGGFVDCNLKALEILELKDKVEYAEKIAVLLPECQPSGENSMDALRRLTVLAFNEGKLLPFEWFHRLESGEPLPTEVTLTRVGVGKNAFVAAYLRDLREQKRMLYDIEQRDLLLQTINKAVAILLDPESTSFEDSLYRSMGMLAQAVDADRVYVWKNHIHDGEMCVTQLYEWSEGATPQQGTEYTVNVSYSKTIPDFRDVLINGDCINSIASNMSERSRTFLSDTQVVSIFVAPLFVNGQFWGFVGFDDCEKERTFTDNEASILRSGCLMIGSAFLRNDMMINLKKNVEEMMLLQAELEIALDQAKAASLSKSSFLANMSHEIRTPMNSIIGFTELAMDDDVSLKTMDYLAKILENSEWLLQIINDILDISKIESGRMELENIPFDLHDMFDACRTLILPKALEKGLSMHFYAEPSIGKRLYGDPTRLRQALLNFLSNAVKFTNSGMIKVQAAIKEIAENSVTMYFEIKDSGIGIAPELLSSIFDPFMQAETGTTRKYGGSGLGLAITKNIIEMMGGTLSVDSAPGLGSRFSFQLTFNAVNITPEEKSTEVSLDNIEKPSFDGEVLLCEDNIMNQQVISEHLSRVGLSTVIAPNGKKGVQFVADRMEKGEKMFDLIFMDIHMPIMDGLEASAKILEMNVGVPIVALTANIMTNDRESYTTSGMSDCVGKPFTSKELWRCLLKYLKPVGWQTDDDLERFKSADDEMRQIIINGFVKENRGKYSELCNALDAGDIKLAHRIVHALKSNAAHIGRSSLKKAAFEAEEALKGGMNNVTPEQMKTLEAELTAALAELEPLIQG
jgi:signal transduction histidine kinase/PAS domain-containing protein/HPt (histidine-containing phosphotransfer) domain-containing protein